MLHDYFRSFWRSLLRNKLTAFINIGGLALGLAVFFALTFYVHREFSYDAQWQDAERIYTVSSELESPSGNSGSYLNFSPYVLGTTLQTNYPDAIETYARLLQRQASLRLKDEEIARQSVILAEPALLELLQFKTVAGSLQDVFADPHAIALSEATVTQYFADASPLGQTLTFTTQEEGKRDYVVRAVFALPEPSSFKISYLARLDTAALAGMQSGLELWDSTPKQYPLSLAHYFKLSEGVDAKQLEHELRQLMDEHKYLQRGDIKTRIGFVPLLNVHLWSGSLFDTADNVMRLWVYAVIGVLVLLVSGCNFVMLATLRSVDRIREVGIRKTLGSSVGSLVRQYLFDAFCQSLLAMLLAIAMLELSLPWLAQTLHLPLDLQLLSERNLGACLLMIGGFTLISSAYPAWLLTKGKPALLLRNSSSAVVGSGNFLRKILVGIQFATVIMLLLGAAVVRLQISYSQQRDRGFSLENVVSMRLSNVELYARTATLVSELIKVTGVQQAAATGTLAPSTIAITTPTKLTYVDADGNIREGALKAASVLGSYFSTLSARVLAGREFSIELDDTTTNNTCMADCDEAKPTANTLPERKVILNLAATQALGFATPEQAIDQLLQQEVRQQDGQVKPQSLRVIGVVADIQYASLMLPPVAEFYTYGVRGNYIAVKLAAGVEASTVMPQLQAVWTQVMGAVPFVPLTAEQVIGQQLQREETEARIVTGSTLLALVIALLGLYGLVATTVVKRIKEIGVRKIMGADNASIVWLLLWQFSKPIIVANVVAWPLGLWAINQWLQRFPYRLDMQQIVLSGVTASVLALLIAWATVGLMAAKAAGQKPVLALRYE
jgi:putative ABC transport system permease protein